MAISEGSIDAQQRRVDAIEREIDGLQWEEKRAAHEAAVRNLDEKERELDESLDRALTAVDELETYREAASEVKALHKEALRLYADKCDSRGRP